MRHVEKTKEMVLARGVRNYKRQGENGVKINKRK